MSEIVLTDEQKECINSCYSEINSILKEKSKQGNYDDVHSTLEEAIERRDK